ncbi:hypothetical protein MNBD_GAMMA25-1122 [hydrothermal vent metagenome]|uniref:Cytochrome c domain-containing protein n=1 Tax=hydrothermal vent metagenome TaxID=652676 RepID=A0A3B1B7E2_9ZZZZ
MNCQHQLTTQAALSFELPLTFQRGLNLLLLLSMLLSSLLIFLLPADAEAIPVFARKYKLSCNACHAAFPRLNEFGQQFVDNNYRLPNWKDSTVNTGDDMLALPDSVPLAIRAQAYVQQREASSISVENGDGEQAKTDIQGPYLIKLLSSAPLSDHVSYYFYGIFAEKGDNGTVIIEDAWFSHDDLFGSEVGMMLGQFQVSDLMFPRETRLSFQDFMVYRMAGLTYDRGLVFNYDLGPVGLDLGAVNGNGISNNLTINSPGYKRPDHMFDNDTDKALFARLGAAPGGVDMGLFYYAGSQKNATGAAGTVSGTRDTDKNAWGVDLSGKLGDKTWWFAQAIWNDWQGFIEVNQDYRWFGAFVGVDYVYSDRWTYSLLYNFTDAGDLDNTDTVYEGINMNSLTATASYYFMRNIKAVLEVNADFQKKVEQSGLYYTGHLTGENYALVGLDAAF